MNNSDVMTGCIANMLAVTVANIKDVLSIVSIAVSLLFTLVLIGAKVYKYLKNDGKIDESEKQDILKDVEEAKKQVDNLANNLKDGDDKNV